MRKGSGIVMVLSLLLTIACSTATCPMDTVVTCNYDFFDADGNTSVLYDTLTVTIAKPTTFYIYTKEGKKDSVSRTRITALVDSGYTETVKKLKVDTTLVNNLANGGSIKVPMSYYASVDTLVLHYKKILLPDTMYVFHEGYTHVETPECGSYRFHNLKEIRTTDRCIDRVEIINPKVNYEKEFNVKIYFNTLPE